MKVNYDNQPTRFRLQNLGLKVALAILTGVLGPSPVALAQEVPTVSNCRPQDYVEGSLQTVVGTGSSFYKPKCLKVHVGSSVTIQASSHHPLSAMPKIGQSVNPFADHVVHTTPQTRVMTEPGYYGYFCTAHGDSEGDGMAGAIWVIQ